MGFKWKYVLRNCTKPTTSLGTSGFKTTSRFWWDLMGCCATNRWNTSTSTLNYSSAGYQDSVSKGRD